VTLQSNVEARYSIQSIKNLTNPDSATSTTKDSTRLALACTDAAAMFEEHTGTEYDDTVAMHVNAAVEGVIAILKSRKSAKAGGSRTDLDTWVKRLRHFDVTYGSRARMEPETTGLGIPSSEDVTTGTERPKFDDPLFDDLRPDDPRTGNEEDQ